jgi:hypothetical protein
MYVISQVSKFVPTMMKASTSLTSHYQKLTPDEHVEIRNQSTSEEAVEPEPGPEERTTTAVKLKERPGPTEDGISVSENTEWNEQRVTATAE